MNNKQKMFDNSQRFGFRKLNIGLASVLIGLTFMTGAGLVHSDTVHADTVQSQDDSDTDNEIPDIPANPGDDIHQEVDYEAQDETQTVHYTNPDGTPAKNPDGSNVSDTTITGKTDSHADTPIPGGWKDHDPASHTNDTIPRPGDDGKVPDKNVVIDHDETTVTHDNPAVPNSKIPAGDNNKNAANNYTYPADTKAQKDNLNGTAHRHITIETPDHKDENSRTSQTIDQTIDYNRDAKVDTVTGEVNSYTPWEATDSTKTGFDEKHIDAIDGYDISVTGATEGTDYVKNSDGSITIKANTPDPTKFANSVTDTDPTKILPNVAITVKYNAKAKTVTIHYVDDDNNGQPAKNAQDKTINAVTDQNLDGSQLTYNIPSIYHLADNAGEVTTFHVNADDSKNVITVHLKQNTGVPIDPNAIPAGTKNPEDGDNPITKDEFTHDVHRTVTVDYPASYTGEKPDLSQTITLSRTATYNQVTGVVTWSAWSTDKFDAETPAIIAGYTPSVSSIAEMPVTHATVDQAVHITYTAGKQSMTWTFVDDDEGGKTVGSPITLTGNTDTSIATGDLAKGLAIPKNYDLDDTYTNTGMANVNQIPTSFTFHATNTPVTIHLKHHHQDIDASNIPTGAKDKNDQHVITANDFSKTINRTIEFDTPAHESSTSFNTGASAQHHDQSVTLQRHGDYDAVTGLVTWKSWSEADLDAVNVGTDGIPTFDGYDIDTDNSVGFDKGSNRIDAMHVTSDTPSSVAIIRYKAQDHKVTYHFVDENGKQQTEPDGTTPIADEKVSGKTDDTINTPKLPDGWVLDGDTLDPTVKVPTSDTTVNVKIKHGQITVTHDNPVKSGDKIPGTMGKTYGDGLTQNDLNQQGTRTIVFKFPKTYSLDNTKKVLGNGDKYTQVTYDEADNTATVIQTVHFTRDAIVDTVTGKVVEYKGAKEFTNAKTGEKSLWDSDPANGDYAVVKIPQISGYKSTVKHVDDENQSTPTGLNFARYYVVNFAAVSGNPGSKVPSEPAKTPDDTNPGDATHVDKPGAVDNKGQGTTTDNNKGQGTAPDNNKGQNQGTTTNSNEGQGAKTNNMNQGTTTNDMNQGTTTNNMNQSTTTNDMNQGAKTNNNEGQGAKTNNNEGQGAKTNNNEGQGAKTNDNKNGKKSAKNVVKKSGKDLDAKSSSKKIAKNTLNSNSKGISNMVTTVSTVETARDNAASEGNIAGTDNSEGAGVHTAQAATVNNGSKSLPQTGEKQGVMVSILGALAAGFGILGLVGAKRKKKN